MFSALLKNNLLGKKKNNTFNANIFFQALFFLDICTWSLEIRAFECGVQQRPVVSDPMDLKLQLCVPPQLRTMQRSMARREPSHSGYIYVTAPAFMTQGTS